MTEQRLSDTRLREIVAEHEAREKSCITCRGIPCESCCPHQAWPCETRQLAEELIERRKPRCGAEMSGLFPHTCKREAGHEGVHIDEYVGWTEGHRD